MDAARGRPGAVEQAAAPDEPADRPGLRRRTLVTGADGLGPRKRRDHLRVCGGPGRHGPRRARQRPHTPVDAIPRPGIPNSPGAGGRARLALRPAGGPPRRLLLRPAGGRAAGAEPAPCLHGRDDIGRDRRLRVDVPDLSRGSRRRRGHASHRRRVVVEGHPARDRRGAADARLDAGRGRHLRDHAHGRRRPRHRRHDAHNLAARRARRVHAERRRRRGGNEPPAGHPLAANPRQAGGTLDVSGGRLRPRLQGGRPTAGVLARPRSRGHDRERGHGPHHLVAAAVRPDRVRRAGHGR